MSVAVVYLARLAEGIEPIRRFAESYRKHPAGAAHSLIVVYKGASSSWQRRRTENGFANIPHTALHVPDDIGFDIHAYRYAAERVNHDLCLFLNTFSVPLAANWLAKLTAPLDDPAVAIVGATGSFESLRDSSLAIHKIAYLLARQGPDLATREYVCYFTTWRRRLLNRAIWIASAILKGPMSDDQVRDYWARKWLKVTLPGGPFERVQRFPPFPNPHVRSNAFVIRRRDFLEWSDSVAADKIACCEFESGWSGMSRRAIERAQRFLIVGANGSAYDVDAWPDSGTFRNVHQHNLLFEDNQTRSYNRMSPRMKELHRWMSWGRFSVSPPTVRLLDIEFPSQTLVSETLRLYADNAVRYNDRVHVDVSVAAAESGGRSGDRAAAVR